MAHYVVFIRPSGETVTGQEQAGSSRWRMARRRAGGWPSHAPGSVRRSTPGSRSQALPDELVGAVMLQASHDRPAFDPAGPGPGLEDPRRLRAAQPDQVAISFGGGSRAGAGLDLEDFDRRRGDRPADRPGSERHRPSAAGRYGSAGRRDPDRGGRLVLDRGPGLAERSGGPTSPGLRGRSGAGHGLLVRPRRRDARTAGDPGSR